MVSLKQRIINKLYSIYARNIRKKSSEVCAENLRKNVSTLKIEMVNSTEEWLTNQSKLKDHILNSDIDDFLNWDVIRRTMFTNCNYNEFETLCKSKYWKYLKKGMKEDFIGNPRRYHSYPFSSGNLLHHGFSLLQLISIIGIEKFKNTRSIFEYGGGYGSMCRSINRMIPSLKDYTIFDFEIFNYLQYFFLNSIKLGKPIYLNEKHKFTQEGIYLVNTDPEFHLADKELFIALWSLSESTIEVRNKIAPYLKEFNFILISYQKKFNNIDNLRYFDELSSKTRGFKWFKYQAKELPNNYYLIGVKE